jgi:hypothetical protein
MLVSGERAGAGFNPRAGRKSRIPHLTHLVIGAHAVKACQMVTISLLSIR